MLPVLEIDTVAFEFIPLATEFVTLASKTRLEAGENTKTRCSSSTFTTIHRSPLVMGVVTHKQAN